MWVLFKCVCHHQEHTGGGDGDENASDESDGGDDEGNIAEAGKKCRKLKKHGKDGSLDRNKEQFTPTQMDSFEVLEFLL